ncbi:MAG: TlpA family protein disulfide reductase [Bacteroidales bacterium]|nr:TlpA family protein disulfide reductase [Bacteroidales bacterium]
MKQTDKKFTKMSLIGLKKKEIPKTFTNINLQLLIILLFLVFLPFQIFSQTKIEGVSSSYSGDELKLCKISDRITFTHEVISSALVDSAGNFEFSFDINRIEKVYIDLPTLRAFLYVEPEKSYEIRIPSKIEMTDEQFLNPYFSKEYVPAMIVKSPENDINLLIIEYNSFLNEQKNKLVKITNDKKEKEFIDSIKVISDTFMQNIDNEYFVYHKMTDFALLRHYHIQYKKSFFTDSFFVQMPVLFNSASYMGLFNLVFDDPFKTGNSIVSLKYVYAGIKNHNFIMIKDSIISKFPKISETFAELLTIKGLYNKFYEIPQTQNDIIATLQNVLSDDVNDDVLNIIQNILIEITTLRVGNPAPQFELPNFKGKNINLTDYKGGFVYIQFFHQNSFACMQQMPLLKNYSDQKIKGLNILTVFVQDNVEQMKEFLENNKDYKWDFVFMSKNDELLKKYNVTVYPTYFLVDPDGNLCLPETPAPTDNFEQTYNAQFKKWFGN